MVKVFGNLLGFKFYPETKIISLKIIHSVTEQRPTGPADNSIILIDCHLDGVPSARYLSWINYYDLDVASAKEPHLWNVVDPWEAFSEEVEWKPYG